VKLSVTGGKSVKVKVDNKDPFWGLEHYEE